MSDLKTWDQAAGGNIETPPDGAPEGMDKATVNDVIREVMAATRRWYQDPHWINAFATTPSPPAVTRLSSTQIQIAGADYTALFPADRRVRFEGGTVDHGFVDSSSYAAGNTTVTVTADGGSVPVGTNAILFAVLRGGRAAYRNVLESGGSLVDTTKVVCISGLDTALAGSAFLKNAAERDVGVAADQVPINSDLGSAAYQDIGSGISDVVNGSRLDDARPYGAFYALGADVINLTAAGDRDVTGLTGLSIPGANGVRSYRVRCFFVAQENGGGSCVFKLFQGPNGNSTDTAVITWTETLSAATPEGFVTFDYRIVSPATGTKIGLTANFNNATNTIFAAGVVNPGGQLTDKRPDAQPTYILIEEEKYHA